MLVLYSSNSSAKYIRDVMSAAAYPAGHVLRMRYDKKYINSDLRVDRVSPLPTKSALIVYAETDSSESHFEFYPIRHAKVVRYQASGSAYFIDVKLGDYPVLDDNSRLIVRHALKGKGRLFPLPRLHNGNGLGWWRDGEQWVVREYQQGDWAGNYLDVVDADALDKCVGRDDRAAWQSVVDSLRATSLGICPFFAVNGLMRRRTFLSDVRVKPKERWPEVDYRLPAGEHFVVRVDTYHPDEARPFILSLTHKGDGIAGVVPESVVVDSRYDELRILVATKRLLDDVLSPLIVTAQVPDSNGTVVTVKNPWSAQVPYTVNDLLPQLIFPTRVGVRPWKLFGGYLVIALSVLLLASNADYWRSVAVYISNDLGLNEIAAFCKGNADGLAIWSRALGAFATVGVSLALLRKIKMT